jgi:hypothetical protein
MSTGDARLSPQERAALASLEAAAAADDPEFAARLRGSSIFRFKTVAPRLAALGVGQWRALMRHGIWGVPLTVIGFVFMVLGLSVGAWLAVGGALLAAVGLRLLAQFITAFLERRRQPEAEPEPE